MNGNLIVKLDPPPKRAEKCKGSQEWHLTEAAVMLAFARHLLETVPNASAAVIHPDGEHAKRFDIGGWLNAQGFQRSKSLGGTAYGGTYTRGGQTVTVNPKSGIGDVVVEVDGLTIVAECKGGIVNTDHAGQLSRLRKGLCEAVGALMARPEGGRQIAVVPKTDTTLRLARRMFTRARAAGIEIALVDSNGNVVDVK